MTRPALQPLESLQFEADELMKQHPPRVRSNKKIVFAIACPRGSAHHGRIAYSRWPAMSLDPNADLSGSGRHVVGRPGFYDYAPESDLQGAVEWHVNFADPRLFGAYDSALFAQDEMQVAEHPALGALREALLDRAMPAVTVERGKPTPVLISGVERRCSVATEPDPSQARPVGLYGNQFDFAAPDAIERATRRIDPPTITNLIAIAAPAGGQGRYTAGDVVFVLVTAYSGFRVALHESRRIGGADRPVVVHTGYWGCGAFGGNRVLMAMLQMIAADMAKVDRLVVHTGADGAHTLATARETLARVLEGPDDTLRERIEQIVSLSFEWGEGDGN